LFLCQAKRVGSMAQTMPNDDIAQSKYAKGLSLAVAFADQYFTFIYPAIRTSTATSDPLASEFNKVPLIIHQHCNQAGVFRPDFGVW